MVNSDTISLLRECNSGIKMGVSSIDEVMEDVRENTLSQILSNSKEEHEKLARKTKDLLFEYNDDTKEPNPIAKGMSWVMTNVKLSIDPSDQKIADIITDGCNMGVKSLSRYLNQYAAADEKSKDIAKSLITIEERLSCDMRDFL